MRRTEGEFAGAGGLGIRWRAWAPDAGDPVGHLVISHGYGEYGERYARLAERLSTAAFTAWAHDQRGHGLSEGRRGVLDRLDNATSDLGAMVELAAERDPEKPVFVLGHSMGGAIALAYALAHQEKLTGLVLSAPAASYDGHRQVPPVSVRAAAAVASAVVPRAPAHRIDLTTLTRDLDERRAYMDDPLIERRRQPARTTGEILRAFERFRSDGGELTLPLLALHGTADRITSPGGSRMVVEAARSVDKQLRLYDGYFHELLNEPRPDRDRVMDEIVGWLLARCPGDPRPNQGLP